MADENNIENAGFSFDEDKVYNKVIFGAKAEAATKKTLIDMTKSGDTPGEKSTGTTVDLIDAAFILSSDIKTPTPYTSNGNRAWGSDGKLITGSCTYSADVREDSIQAGDVLEGETFHAGPVEEGMSPAGVGTLKNYRGATGVPGETGAQDVLKVSPLELVSTVGENPTWLTTRYIPADNNFAGEQTEQPTHSYHGIAEGAYGVLTSGGSDHTKIYIDLSDSDYVNYISNQVYLFGKRGELGHNLVHKDIAAKLDSQTVSPTGEEDGFSDVTVGETPVDYVEDSTLTGSYTIYIGEYA